MQSEIPAVNVVSMCFGSLTEREWEEKWNSWFKRPHQLSLLERDFLLGVFCEVHFSARPSCDLDASDCERLIPKCTGWIGLALRHLFFTSSEFYMEELIGFFLNRPELVGALLFGSSDDYLQVMVSPDRGHPIAFELTDPQSQFLRRIKTNLRSPNASDMLRKRMDQFQPTLAKKSQSWMKAHIDYSPAEEQVSPGTGTSVAFADYGKQNLTYMPESKPKLSPLVMPFVTVCFLSVIAGFELLKFALAAPEIALSSDLMTLVMPALEWGETIATHNFFVLELATLFLVFLQRRTVIRRAHNAK